MASEDLFKTACKQVKNVRGVKKVKNKSEDVFGNKMGQIHIPGITIEFSWMKRLIFYLFLAQEIKKIQTRKVKALKESKEEKLEEIKKKKEKAESARQNAIEKVFG